MHHLNIQLEQPPKTSEISIGKGIRSDLGRLIKGLSNLSPGKVGVVSNKRVFGLYGLELVRSLRREDFKVFKWLMPEGERYKSFGVLKHAVEFLADNSFERNDVVVALGGGVVGDLAGLGAAVYLRGIPLVQVPTTLLAQIDSSVGGKAGINLSAGKNLVGAFHQPSGVVIDIETLASLPRRELVSGFCEMVKQSLVASRSLFAETVEFLQKGNGRPSDLLNAGGLEELIAAHCSFKASIVANDERESIIRSDRESRKILNFGHTTAHALEAITDYRTFRHGEAVGYGMLVAGEISKNLGILGKSALESLREAVVLCGPLPRADGLEIGSIMRLMQHDKKSVGGQIHWVLLDEIGSPRIVAGSQISSSLLRLSLKAGLQAPARKSIPTNGQAKIKRTR